MRRPSLDMPLAYALIATLGLCCAVGVYLAAGAASQRIPLDPNEGWNAYHQAAAISGANLYPDGHSFIVNNYPPLSFYLIGGLGLLVGDNIIAGRFVSFISFFFVVFAIGACARAMGTRRAAAVFAGLFFAAVLLLFSDYVGINDPQLMGHGMQLGALLILLREPRGTLAVLLSSGLFAVSLFTKHNLIVLPVSILVWLALYDRRSALQLGLAGLSLGLAGLAAFRLIFGSGLPSHLATPRTYSLVNLEHGARAAMPWATAPLGSIAILLLRFGLRDRYAVLSAIYAGLACAFGIFLLGGAGVDANAMFDTTIALSFASALLIERVASRGLPAVSILVALFMLGPAINLASFADSTWLSRDFWLHPARDEAETTRIDIDFLQGRSGSAVCETLPLCYWAGKDATVDVFNLGQAFATGARNESALVSLIDRRSFSVLEFESLVPFQLGGRVLDAVKRNYRVARTSDNGIFMTPNPSR